MRNKTATLATTGKKFCLWDATCKQFPAECYLKSELKETL